MFKPSAHQTKVSAKVKAISLENGFETNCQGEITCARSDLYLFEVMFLSLEVKTLYFNWSVGNWKTLYNYISFEFCIVRHTWLILTVQKSCQLCLGYAGFLAMIRCSMAWFSWVILISSRLRFSMLRDRAWYPLKLSIRGSSLRILPMCLRRMPLSRSIIACLSRSIC